MIDIHALLKKMEERDPGEKLLVKEPGIQKGDTVIWNSPLFGCLSAGPVLAVDKRHYELIHPLTGERVSLPLAWVGPPLSPRSRERPDPRG